MTVQGPWKPHYAQAYARSGRDGIDVTRISSAAFVKDVPALKALRLTSRITNDAAALANPSLVHVDLCTRSKAPLDFTQTPNMAVAAFEWRPDVVGLDSCEQLEMVQLYTWDGSGFRWLGKASPLLDLYVGAQGAGDECTLDGLENAQRLRSLNFGHLSRLCDADRLAGLHGLQTLVLGWRDGAARQPLDLSFLQGLTELRELQLHGPVDVASLTILDELDSLRRVMLRGIQVADGTQVSNTLIKVL